MRFPFVTREHHDDVVRIMRSQLEGLLRQLYPQGVPAEAYLLLGMKEEACALPQPKLQGEPEDKPPTEEQVLKEERNEDRRRLTSLRRTSPTRFAKEMGRVMVRDMTRGLRRPEPRHIFEKAHAEATAESDAAASN
jgi:hypothetical protein